MSFSEVRPLKTLTKKHALLEQLVPSIQIRAAGIDVLTIPFNHITQFEMAMGTTSKATASMQLFDPTFKNLDILFYNLTQLAYRGSPIRIRWGYAFVPENQNILSIENIDAEKNKYLSEEYNFIILQTQSDTQAAGNYLTIQMAPIIFDPVITAIPFNKKLISGALKNGNKGPNGKTSLYTSLTDTKTNPVKARVLETLGKESFEKFVKNLKAAQSGKLIGTSVNGKLTFDRIFTELMKQATDNQTEIGRRREVSWQQPLPIFPDNLDLEYDVGVFDGQGDSIYICLQRLAKIMMSTKPVNDNNFATVYNSSTVDKDGGARNRMIGGDFTFVNGKFKNIKDNVLYDGRGVKISPDQVKPEQNTFIMWRFNEAKYVYTLKPTEPLATYVFYGGENSAGFNKDNLPEILEFSVNLENISKYFADPSLLNLKAITNPTTGVAVRPATNLNRGQIDSLATTTREAAAAGGTDQGVKTSGTNPTQDSETKTSTGSVTPTGDKVNYNVPLVGSIDGETVGRDAELFLDSIRTKAGQKFPVNMDITIIGDPDWEPTYINNSLKLIFRNRLGEENPLYSGDYTVLDIRHAIDNSGYKTHLKCLKSPLTNDDIQREVRGGRVINKSEPLETARLEVILSLVDGTEANGVWKTSSIQAASVENNRERVNNALRKTVKGSSVIIEDSITGKIDNELSKNNISFDDAVNKVKSVAISFMYDHEYPVFGKTKTKVSKSGTKSTKKGNETKVIETKFTIKTVKYGNLSR